MKHFTLNSMHCKFSLVSSLFPTLHPIIIIICDINILNLKYIERTEMSTYRSL
jgi:hypothetical protein